MNHLFKSLITLATIALFASCAREPGDPRGVASGDRIPATFELKMDGVATKAFSDGNSANALLVGVYNKQGEGETAKYTYLDELSKETVADAITVSGKAATFETNLVRGQNYVVVFWAQKSDCTAYAVDFAAEKLTVTTTGNANDESRDAFYKVFETGPITETNYNFVGIELTRPFAQINVLAPNEDVVAAAKSKVLFSKSALTVKKAPNTMDLLTGGVSGSADYTYSAAAITEPAFGDYANTHTYIAMDYILAGDTKGVYDVALDVYSTVGEVEQSPIHFDVTSAPAQRNYRTNIIGNVFTIDASFNIIINPIYNTPDYSEGLGLTFEPTTITPTVPATLPEGVSITPAGGTTPSVINFGVAALNASTPVTIPVTPSVNTTVKARSSNVAVATAEVVDGPKVKVTPVGPGEAVITIYTDAILATKSADVDSTKNYAGAKYEYKVVVEKPVEKKDVAISINDINLKVGEGCELEPDVDPEELYTQIVATPAEGYATYFDWDAENWIIEAKKVTPAEGIAITLSYPGDDTYKEASKTIKVYISEKPVPEVLFENITVTVDQEDALTYVVDDTLEASVTFDEGEQDIYDVYKLGEVWKIKGLKRGSAELTLKVAETTTTAPTSVTVTVTSNGKTPIFVTEDQVEINVGDVKQLTKEEDYDLDSDGAVTFSIAETYAEILTCTPSGQIKGLAEGTAKVSINVAASDTFEAGSEELNVKVNPAPVVEPVTATISIEGVPTTDQEPGATFDVTITTNSTAALVVSATTGASVAPKSGNVYTVTAADDLTADTEVTLTASVAAVENAFTAAEKTAKFTVKKKEVVVPPTSSEYVKVTSTADVTDGVYLIVYEEGGLAFDGSLETLDAAGNTVAVTIANGKIAGTEAIDAAIFTLDVVDGGFSVKSASGKFIGQTKDDNGLASGETAYVNVVTIADEGANLVSGGAYLRYNSASNQTRFRYFKSATYSNQKTVALYKKTGSGTGTVPTQKKDATVTINGTIPTDAMAKDASFEFTAETTSDATAFDVKLSPEGAATVAAKSGAANTWIVTAGEPAAETTVTLTVSVAATNEYKAASATKTFKVAKKAGDDPETKLDGDYVLAVKVGDEYIAAKSALTDGSTKRIVAESIEYSGSGSINAASELVWTIATISGGYSIKGETGYISWSSGNSANIASEAYALSITEGNGGTYQIASVADATRKFQYNSASNAQYFAFYTSEQVPDFYLIPATAVEDNRQEQNLSFSATTATATVGAAFTAPTLSGAQTTVTYSSSKPEVATVDASTGAVTIVAAGNTVITAVAVANDSYKEGKASYTLTVAAAPSADALFEETFANGQGNFTIEDKELDGLSYVWKHDSSYKYMKASAYASSTNHPAESWLISPVVDLTAATTAVLTFDHVRRFGGTPAEELTLQVREENGSWTAVTIPTYSDGSNWTFVSSGDIDLSSYAGKKIQFAFKYTSTSTGAATWEIKNVKISK